MTAELDASSYLASKGISTRRAGGHELQIHCLWCADGDPKGHGRMYLNTDSWLYTCFRCLISGNRRTLLEHFGDQDELTYAEGADPAARRLILSEAADLAHEMLLANDKMLDYVLERGLTAEQIVAKRLGYVPPNVGLSDMLPSRERLKIKDLVTAGVITTSGREFFNNSLVIPYFSHGQVVQLRERSFRSGGPKYRSMGGDLVRLYNSDALLGADTVMVVEGEMDANAVEAQILEAPERTFGGMVVVGLAGAGTWPEHLIEMLQQCRKVFIGMDPDETGKRAADKLKGEIGAKARIVELPDGEPKTDWTDFFKPHSPANPNGGNTWRDLHTMLVAADMSGKRMFTITDSAVRWEQRRSEAPGIKLGWPSLDAVLRPGLKPGQLFVPFAATGVGKTVVLDNIVHNTRANRLLYVSLEMTAAEIYEHMYRIHRFWNPKADRSQMSADYQRLRVADPNRLKAGELEGLIDEYADEVGAGPDIVIVDYLQYYAGGFKANSKYDKVTDAVMDLKAIAKGKGCVVISPSQANRGTERGKPLSISGMRDAGTLEETADFVLGMFRPDQQVNDENEPVGGMTGSFKTQLLKSRHGGAGRLFDLRLSNMSLALADTLDYKATARIDQENALVRQGIHYDDFRRQQDLELSEQRLEFNR